MKLLIILVNAFLLQACVGASLLTSHEGTRFIHPDNLYKHSPTFKSIAQGYSTEDSDDPGSPLKLENLEVMSNCYKEKLISFSPSLVIPFPPIIPVFYPGEDSLSEQVQITVIGTDNKPYQVQSLITNGLNPKLLNENENTFTFDFRCKDLSESSKITILGPDGAIEIELELIKVYNFGWGWLGA